MAIGEPVDRHVRFSSNRTRRTEQAYDRWVLSDPELRPMACNAPGCEVGVSPRAISWSAEQRKD
jgi:hypothetical protein